MTKRRTINHDKKDNVVKLNAGNSVKSKTRGLTPFKPGQSGNPSGRPKIPAEFSHLMKDYSVEAAEELRYWMHLRDPKVSPQIAMYIINRAYGMPTQSTELSGPGGSALQPPSLQVNFVVSNTAKTPETIDG